MDKETAGARLREAVKLDPRGAVGKFARSLMKLADAVQYKDAV
jgi:hypothetical protein